MTLKHLSVGAVLTLITSGCALDLGSRNPTSTGSPRPAHSQRPSPEPAIPRQRPEALDTEAFVVRIQPFEKSLEDKYAGVIGSRDFYEVAMTKASRALRMAGYTVISERSSELRSNVLDRIADLERLTEEEQAELELVRKRKDIEWLVHLRFDAWEVDARDSEAICAIGWKVIDLRTLELLSSDTVRHSISVRGNKRSAQEYAGDFGEVMHQTSVRTGQSIVNDLDMLL